MLTFETPPDPRYQPIARIGRGGMADVVLAAMRSNGVTKLAVLKCLLPDLAEDPDFVEMFLDEARLCARLNHPNVVQTYEVLHHGARLAIAMEYLEGQPLTSVLTRLGGDLDLATRLRIITRVLAGLEYAHNLTDFDGTPLRVVHRDVSPQNVFVTYDGQVKLVDFGIAKTLWGRQRTQPGNVRGKLAYLAPEAFRGRVVDHRADLFSVGVMLWEVVAGRRIGKPMRNSNDAWCLVPGASPPELPAELDLPVALRAVCRRALAIDPDARYQSAAELGAALEEVGAPASDAHARQLGQLVSLAFQREVKQRRGLLELGLRDGVGERSGVVEPASPDVASSGFTVVEESRSEEAVPAPAPQRASAVKRGPGWSLTVLVAGAAAAIALVSGAHLVSIPSARAWLVGARAPSSAERATPARSPNAAPVPPTPFASPVPPVVGLAPRERPAPRDAIRERRPHRHRSHLSDDVLDIDGSPLPPSRGSGVWPAWNN